MDVILNKKIDCTPRIYSEIKYVVILIVIEKKIHIVSLQFHVSWTNRMPFIAKLVSILELFLNKVPSYLRRIFMYLRYCTYNNFANQTKVPKPLGIQTAVFAARFLINCLKSWLLQRKHVLSGSNFFKKLCSGIFQLRAALVWLLNDLHWCSAAMFQYHRNVFIEYLYSRCQISYYLVSCVMRNSILFD